MPAAIFWVTIFENIACHAYQGKIRNCEQLLREPPTSSLPLYKAAVHKSSRLKMS